MFYFLIGFIVGIFFNIQSTFDVNIKGDQISFKHNGTVYYCTKNNNTLPISPDTFIIGE